MLRKAWDAEGSPFKGQPFDPNIVQFENQNFLLHSIELANKKSANPYYVIIELKQLKLLFLVKFDLVANNYAFG